MGLSDTKWDYMPSQTTDAGSVSFAAVVVTHEREEYFREAYRSVERARESYDGTVSTIVVNSSEQRMLDDPPSHVTEIHVPEKGSASEKRNVGLESATADWIAFVDDDCVLDETAFEAVAARIEDPSIEDPAGFYPVTEFSGEKSIALRACEHTTFTMIFDIPGRAETVPWGALTFAAFDRSALLDVGGLDQSFTAGAGGEDVDLGLRLSDGGHVLYAISEPLVFHTTATWNSVRGNLQRFYAYGLGEVDLQAKYPERRGVNLATAPIVGIGVLGASAIVALAHSLTVGLLTAALFSVFAPACHVLSHTVNFDKSLRESVILRLYDYAYGAGVIANSIRQGRPGATFFRLDPFAPPDESGSPFDRSHLIYPGEAPGFVALSLVFLTVIVVLAL